MKQYDVTLSFGPSQCSLLSRSTRPVIISRSLATGTGKPEGPSPIGGHRIEEVESDPENQMSASMASRFLKRKNLKAFVALIMPEEIQLAFDRYHQATAFFTACSRISRS